MAELPTLATVADVEVRMGRQLSDEADTARVKALLEDASASIRTYCGRLFAEAEVTSRFRARGGTIILPLHITSVTSVFDVATNEVSASWDGLRRLQVGGAVNQFDVEPVAVLAGSVAYDVTYLVLDTPPPDVVKAVCAQMAARAFGVKADTTGVQQQSIAGYSYSVGGAAAAGGIGMLPQEQAVLAPFRQVLGNMWVTMR